MGRDVPIAPPSEEDRNPTASDLKNSRLEARLQPESRNHRLPRVASKQWQGYRIAKGPSIPVQADEVYTAEEAAELLGVHRCTVTRWIEAGLLRGQQITDAAP